MRRPQRQRARVRGEVAALERVCVREVLFRGGVVPTQQMRLPRLQRARLRVPRDGGVLVIELDRRQQLPLPLARAHQRAALERDALRRARFDVEGGRAEQPRSRIARALDRLLYARPRASRVATNRLVHEGPVELRLAAGDERRGEPAAGRDGDRVQPRLGEARVAVGNLRHLRRLPRLALLARRLLLPRFAQLELVRRERVVAAAPECFLQPLEQRLHRQPERVVDVMARRAERLRGADILPVVVEEEQLLHVASRHRVGDLLQVPRLAVADAGADAHKPARLVVVGVYDRRAVAKRQRQRKRAEERLRCGRVAERGERHRAAGVAQQLDHAAHLGEEVEVGVPVGVARPVGHDDGVAPAVDELEAREGVVVGEVGRRALPQRPVEVEHDHQLLLRRLRRRLPRVRRQLRRRRLRRRGRRRTGGSVEAGGLVRAVQSVGDQPPRRAERRVERLARLGAALLALGGGLRRHAHHEVERAAEPLDNQPLLVVVQREQAQRRELHAVAAHHERVARRLCGQQQRECRRRTSDGHSVQPPLGPPSVGGAGEAARKRAHVDLLRGELVSVGAPRRARRWTVIRKKLAAQSRAAGDEQVRVENSELAQRAAAGERRRRLRRVLGGARTAADAPRRTPDGLAALDDDQIVAVDLRFHLAEQHGLEQHRARVGPGRVGLAHPKVVSLAEVLLAQVDLAVAEAHLVHARVQVALRLLLGHRRARLGLDDRIQRWPVEGGRRRPEVPCRRSAVRRLRQPPQPLDVGTAVAIGRHVQVPRLGGARAPSPLRELARGVGRVEADHELAFGHVDAFGEHLRRDEHAAGVAAEARERPVVVFRRLPHEAKSGGGAAAAAAAVGDDPLASELLAEKTARDALAHEHDGLLAAGAPLPLFELPAQRFHLPRGARLRLRRLVDARELSLERGECGGTQPRLQLHVARGGGSERLLDLPVRLEGRPASPPLLVGELELIEQQPRRAVARACAQLARDFLEQRAQILPLPLPRRPQRALHLARDAPSDSAHRLHNELRVRVELVARHVRDQFQRLADERRPLQQVCGARVLRLRGPRSPQRRVEAARELAQALLGAVVHRLVISFPGRMPVAVQRRRRQAEHARPLVGRAPRVEASHQDSVRVIVGSLGDFVRLVQDEQRDVAHAQPPVGQHEHEQLRRAHEALRLVCDPAVVVRAVRAAFQEQQAAARQCRVPVYLRPKPLEQHGVLLLGEHRRRSKEHHDTRLLIVERLCDGLRRDEGLARVRRQHDQRVPRAHMPDAGALIVAEASESHISRARGARAR